MVVITVLDRKFAPTWRTFNVVPDDASFVARCRENLHQFMPERVLCACGQWRREGR